MKYTVSVNFPVDKEPDSRAAIALMERLLDEAGLEYTIASVEAWTPFGGVTLSKELKAYLQRFLDNSEFGRNVSLEQCIACCDGEFEEELSQLIKLLGDVRIESVLTYVD